MTYLPAMVSPGLGIVQLGSSAQFVIGVPGGCESRATERTRAMGSAREHEIAPRAALVGSEAPRTENQAAAANPAHE